MFPILKCEMTHLTSFVIISAKTMKTVVGKHRLNALREKSEGGYEYYVLIFPTS